jgi:hypothetical protein
LTKKPHLHVVPDYGWEHPAPLTLAQIVAMIVDEPAPRMLAKAPDRAPRPSARAAKDTPPRVTGERRPGPCR